MTRTFFRVLTILAFIAAAVGIGISLLFLKPRSSGAGEKDGISYTRVIVPGGENTRSAGESAAERMAREEQLIVKAALEEGEVLVSALSGDFDQDSIEEQIIAYRTIIGMENHVSVAFIDYVENTGRYERIWSAATEATMPGTISLYTQDLLGDRSLCVLLAGMNSEGEQILTVFRRSPGLETAGQLSPFMTKIAELRIDGTITVQEFTRTSAYQQGITEGQSFTITTYGRDYESSNVMDKVEISYTYNQMKGVYEQSRTTKIPGKQVEQRLVQKLLSGEAGAFEHFVSGIWYYVSPQGTLDSRQYVYFDTAGREIIFYGNEIQQVFSWQDLTPTRYGLRFTAYNISLPTMKLFVNIELESLDSIKVTAREDLRMRVVETALWDGSYRKAASLEDTAAATAPLKNVIAASYDSSIGKIQFRSDGTYALDSDGAVSEGRYAFFYFGDTEIMELRSGKSGKTYMVKSSRQAESPSPRLAMILSRVRLGLKGVDDFGENPVVFILSKR